ncbi:hypothetical protein QOT17_003878 [Balamuthia mandrillaris]
MLLPLLLGAVPVGLPTGTGMAMAMRTRLGVEAAKTSRLLGRQRPSFLMLSRHNVAAARGVATVPTLRVVANTSPLFRFEQRRNFTAAPRSFEEMRNRSNYVRRRVLMWCAAVAVFGVGVGVPLVTIIVKRYEQSSWPTLPATVISVEMDPSTNIRRVTYRYKIFGRTVERTQEDWNNALFDKLNGTVPDYKVGNEVRVCCHPNNLSLSVLKPGRINPPLDYSHLEGTVVEEEDWIPKKERVLHAPLDHRKRAPVISLGSPKQSAQTSPSNSPTSQQRQKAKPATSEHTTPTSNQ